MADSLKQQTRATHWELLRDLPRHPFMNQTFRRLNDSQKPSEGFIKNLSLIHKLYLQQPSEGSGY